MNPVDMTIKVLQETDNDLPHCLAELDTNRPISHWKTHCVNCGAYMLKPHRRDDCPTQNYEVLTQPKEQQ